MDTTSPIAAQTSPDHPEEHLWKADDLAPPPRLQRAGRSAKVLRTGEAVPFNGKNGTLSIVFPEPSRDQPHEVIALEITHEVLHQHPTNAPRPSATRRPPAP